MLANSPAVKVPFDAANGDDDFELVRRTDPGAARSCLLDSVWQRKLLNLEKAVHAQLTE